MKKDRIRGKFTVVNEVSVSRPSPRFLLFICINFLLTHATSPLFRKVFSISLSYSSQKEKSQAKSNYHNHSTVIGVHTTDPCGIQH